MNSKIALVVVALVALIALIAAGASLVYAQPSLVGTDRDAHSLAGSWIITVEPKDPPVPPFVNYAAMTKDGMIIGSNETGHASIGVWTRTAGNQFAVTFMGYDVSDGQIIQYKVRSTIELSQDGEEFTGPFATDLFDADGNLFLTIKGGVQATRIHVEPLDLD
jgi:hypothetical protein